MELTVSLVASWSYLMVPFLYSAVPSLWGVYYLPCSCSRPPFQILARDEKTDLPNVKGEVKRAIKATFAHLCTTLTRDKCLPLPAVKGESSGDKGRFCHAFNPYL